MKAGDKITVTVGRRDVSWGWAPGEFKLRISNFGTATVQAACGLEFRAHAVADRVEVYRRRNEALPWVNYPNVLCMAEQLLCDGSL